MIIELPKKFPYAGSKITRGEAWIRNGILYIRSYMDYDKIMYALTYAMKGNQQCYYCRRKLTKENVTLDHLYPKSLGGPTVPNNLEPACFKCNTKKTNLNAKEFAIYNSLDKSKREKFLNDVLEEKEKIREQIGYDIPKEFITIRKTSTLKAIKFNKEKGRKYRQVERQYLQYGTLIRPIVIDRNKNVVDGFSVYFFASENGIEEVPVIQLQNVELVE